MAAITPSFKPRTPYVLHYDEQTVVLGEPEHLAQVASFLEAAGKATTRTYWDQAYSGQEDFEPDPEELNAVGMEGSAQDFWDALQHAAFQQAEWPQEETATVYLPQLPAWLEKAQSWHFDPVSPPLGPGAVGGWIRERAQDETGRPVGLFQLTEGDSFWVFATEKDLEGIMELCKTLAPFRQGFDHLTPYLGPDDTIGSVALPLVCREALHEELMVRGVDVETAFWE